MKLSLGITPRDYSVKNGVTYDADALAYFNANTAITSAADKNAINTFYLGLKSDGDSIKCIRENVANLSCIASLKIEPSNIIMK
jgi:hypothetical protein